MGFKTLNAGLQKFRDLELKNLKHIIIIGDRKQASIIGSHQTHGYSYGCAESIGEREAIPNSLSRIMLVYIIYIVEQ